ncbi:MAG: DUF4287 domain-containing protein [Polyangiaceae bacterium]|nr:DUF4287 domain-containing protein [Polyangiaceae bacterium]
MKAKARPARAGEERVQGPASYFPSIEAKYGRPIRHWLELAAALLATRSHMEAVAALKAEHGLGHGHANAVVAHAKAALPR